MRIVEAAYREPAVWADNENWPREVHLFLSVLEDQCPLGDALRAHSRARYQVRAALELLQPDPTVHSWIVPLYTKDAHAWELRFISNQEMPTGQDARLHLPSPQDRIWCMNCTVIRCCQFINGWYEGAVRFKQQQIAFHVEAAT